MAERTSVWVTGDQCSEGNSAFAGLDPASGVVVMIESLSRARQLPYHKRKLVLIFAVMREFATALRAKGWKVDYYAEREDFEGPLGEHIALRKPSHLRFMHQSEYGATQRMQLAAEALGVSVEVTPHSNFISEASDLAVLWKPGQARVTMETFYRAMRKKTGLLLDDDEPAGGSWNYDVRNRKPPKKGMAFPAPWSPPIRESTREVIDMVERRFPDNPGIVGQWDLAVTRPDALRCADDFVAHRLKDFGPYEDAMVLGEPVMYHSQLSALINVGLLHPLELCERAEAAYRSGSVRIESVEGFVRQLIGWREFIWQMYWRVMPEYRSRNRLGADIAVPAFYRTGETDMNCLREGLSQVLERGWTHHIIRLMILGNFGLIAGVDPQALTDWFWYMFVDGYDWVMVPNVIGMTLHADGGVVGTKPYAASANYINSMSNYCGSCRYNPKHAIEADACPFNSLYWDFLARNEPVFAKNPRMTVVMSNWARRDPPWKAAIRKKAEEIRDNLRRGELL